MVIMNAYEQALARTAAREARKARQTLTVPKEPERIELPAPVVAKEKPMTHGEIRVQVVLPRLTRAEFIKAISLGLHSLIGGVR